MIIPRSKIRFYPGELKDISKGFFNKEGDYTKLLENNLKKYLNVRHAITFSSARTGLYFILKSLQLKKGDEIMLASYNAPLILRVLESLNLKPVFADVLEDSHTINPAKLRNKISSKTKAIIVTHSEGFVCKMDKIMEFAKKNNLYVIEDCAHSLGAKYKGKKTGSIGHFGIFSFGYTKQINAFGGGAVTTNNKKLAEKLLNERKKLKNPSKKYVFTRILKLLIIKFFLNKIVFVVLIYPLLIIFSFFAKDILFLVFKDPGKFSRKENISEIQALIALEQLKNLNLINKNRNKNYNLFLDNIDKSRLQLAEKNTIPTPYRICIHPKNKNKLRLRLLLHGIDVTEAWMRNCSNNPNSVSEQLQKEVLYIDSNLDKKEILYIINNIKALE